MDSYGFNGEVIRLQSLLTPVRPWGLVAEQLAELLQQYPDGLTDSITRSSLQQKRKRPLLTVPEPHAGELVTLEAVCLERQLSLDSQLELSITAVHEMGRLTLGPIDKHMGQDLPGGAPSIRHILDDRFQRSPLLHRGRLMRLTGCVAAETLAQEPGTQQLLLLPTPMAVLVFKPTEFTSDQRDLAEVSAPLPC